jgi:hypothetical protein
VGLIGILVYKYIISGFWVYLARLAGVAFERREGVGEGRGDELHYVFDRAKGVSGSGGGLGGGRHLDSHKVHLLCTLARSECSECGGGGEQCGDEEEAHGWDRRIGGWEDYRLRIL